MLWMLAPALTLAPLPTPQKVTNGPFEVVVLAVPDIEAFDREWGVKSPGANMTTTHRLIRNKPTYVVVLFGGCAKNPEGNCRIDVRHEVTTPRGGFYDGLDGSKAVPVADIPMADARAFFMAPQLLGIEIEPGEDLGPYRFSVTVTDVNADKKVTSQLTLDAVEAE